MTRGSLLAATLSLFAACSVTRSGQDGNTNEHIDLPTASASAAGGGNGTGGAGGDGGAPIIAGAGGAVASSSGGGPDCGNGVVDPGEDCDPNGQVNTFDCDSDCTTVECGDGHLNGLAGECCEPTEMEDCLVNGVVDCTKGCT